MAPNEEISEVGSRGPLGNRNSGRRQTGSPRAEDLGGAESADILTTEYDMSRSMIWIWLEYGCNMTMARV